MTAGTDWMSYGSELEEGLLDDDRGLDGDCFVFFYPVFKTMYWGNNVKLVMHQISVDKIENPCY